MKFNNVAYDKLFPREKPKKHVESTVEDFEDDDDVQNVYHNWENEDDYEG